MNEFPIIGQCSLCYESATIMRKGSTLCKRCCEIYRKVEAEDKKIIDVEIKKMQELINSKKI